MGQDRRESTEQRTGYITSMVKMPMTHSSQKDIQRPRHNSFHCAFSVSHMFFLRSR
jgi:hypothetical protein